MLTWMNRWNRPTYAIVVAVCLIGSGFRIVLANPVDEVTKRGLQHTTQDRAMVAKAVQRTNDILQGKGIVLTPSWLKKPEQAGRESVPLYLVRTPKDEASSPAAVPSDCRCVFVNPAYLASWIAFNSKGVGRLQLDRGYFLTIVLLHEVGHLEAGNAAVAFKGGEISQLNIDPSEEKRNERKADEFAAELLRYAAHAKPVNMRSIEANFVVNELSKLSWNMQAFRSLDEFGAFAIGKPSVFFDQGFDHPNMALRVLRMNHLIVGTPETRALLESFEEARRRGANPTPLYQKK